MGRYDTRQRANRPSVAARSWTGEDVHCGAPSRPGSSTT